MSGGVPPPATTTTTAGRPPHHHHHRANTHRYSQRSATRYHSSSPSRSDSSASDNVFTPPPPPLPQRPQRAAHVDAVTHDPNRDSYYCWSDGSGSTRLPTFPEEDDHRSCRHTELGDQQQHIRLHRYNKRGMGGRSGGRAPVATAVVYPTAVGYQPAHAPVACNVLLMPTESRSSVGGYVGGNVARGCGGRCETCENVCYYFLQVAFAMGIFIGTSLCIAGATLRRSPSRQLQVLLYIGAVVALVSALLLVVQCRARRQANRLYQQQRRHNNIRMGATPTPTPIHLQQQPTGDSVAVPTINKEVAYVSSHSNHRVYRPQNVVTTMQRGVSVAMLQHRGGYNSATWWK